MTVIPARAMFLGVALVAGAAPAVQARCGDGANDAQQVAEARAEVESVCPCAVAESHSAYVKCAKGVLAARVEGGLLSADCRRSVRRCASKSTCGRLGAVSCCVTTAVGVTKCRIKSDASKCTPPRGGTACVNSVASCCDACTAAGCAQPPATPTATTLATPSPTPVPCDQDGPTFSDIQNRIFTDRGCNLSTCHGNFASANLDLRPGSSLLSLINVVADNGVASAAGKVRVLPGDAAASFLSQKLHGTLLAGEGSRMPLIGAPLPQVEIDVIDAWIDAGAPAVGEIPGAPCLPALEYEETLPPPVPPGGYQVVLDGPWLQPGQEQEGCLWVPVPNPADFIVGSWEFSLNPGTHHFAIFSYTHAGAPPIGVWGAGDVGCISGADFGVSLSGSPQAPFYIDAYPSGVGRLLEAGGYLGLNAHYHNPYDVPIQMKVWTNLYPYPGTPQHLAQTLIDFDDMFTISVPPFTQKLQRGRYTNFSGQTLNIFQLTGHMHKRGLRFTAYASDGSKLYENFDWAHPVPRQFDPHFLLPAGGFIDYECLHDNGVTREVKRNAAGDPVTLTFGLTTDDEMCTLNGQYY